MDKDALDALQEASQAPMPSPEKVTGRNAERRLLMAAKPSKPDIPSSHAPLSNPELIPNSELAVTALQDTIAAYADELRRRARQGNITHKDGQLVASLATASAKLAAEQREQTKELHLSLQSDDDIVKLVIDSVLALGKRGTAILTKALAALPTQGNDS